MSYYMGDYYRGDYYRGDPGFLGSLFGGVVRTVGGAIGGFIKGGPVGAIVGAAGGAGTATARNIQTATLEAGGEGSAYTPALRAKHAAALLRGGAAAGAPIRGGLAVAPRGGAMVGPPMPFHLRRTHLNRSTYVRRGGGTQNLTPGLVIKGTEFVPNRRMNVANPRALRRSVRRLMGFGKIVVRMKRALARASAAVGNVHRARRLPGVRRK